MQRLSLIFPLWLAASLLLAQSRAEKPSSAPPPIPDVRTLMLQVQDHQRQLDKIRENYTFRQFVKTDDLDAGGNIKKSETKENEVFFVNSHHIERLVKKNGKELTPDEQKKEQQRVTKVVKSRSPACWQL